MPVKFAIELLRGQNEKTSFPLIDEEDFVDEPVFTRKTYLATINDVKIQYVKREDL